MKGKLLLGLVFALAPASPLLGQAPAWQFRWQPGLVLQYKVEHTTSAVETVGDKVTENKSKLNLTKRWVVTDVDAQGIATLQLSLISLRLESTPPSGKALLFDSTLPDASDPDLKAQLSKFLGQSLAVIRINSQGKVLEVKESKYGPASGFETTPPFMVVLPTVAPNPNEYWERPYKITLEPPQGTGEKFDAVQRFVCKGITGRAGIITTTNILKTPPEAIADQVPLLQLQPEGEIVFDLGEGRMHSGVMKIDKELKGHQGEGSRYKFQSTYTEEYVGGK